MLGISDKVVCVDDSNRYLALPWRPSPWVKKGQVYVIRDVWEDSHTGVVVVQLVGFPEIRVEQCRCGWHSARFRKLSDVQAENKLREPEVVER